MFSPKTYRLELTLDRLGRAFSGVVNINGQLAEESSQILLHAKDLEIFNATVDGQPATTSFEAKTDELTLQSQQAFKAGDHDIKIEFSSKITDSMNGLYPCYFKLDGKDEELLATQFESHHAREVFPCIDEPAAKATFNLTLITEVDIAVVSNTPIKTQLASDNKKLTTAFETTPIMSTYLLAWVVGKLKYAEAKTKNDVLVRIYATPDKAAQTEFALDAAIKTIEFFNDYFGTAYPLPKCDLIALPDFSSGAMENWGCITFRESCLLVDNTTPTKRKQVVANIIAHELAHQWFGNLVTMQWWNDLWLNESFATWASFLACDHLFPDWQMWTQFFTDETMRAYQRDSLASVQRVQQTVSNPDEIRTLFDPAIVYAKGASLLNMLHSYIGAGAFRKGLEAYLNQHKYGNTVTNDLWQALSEASGKDVGGFMQPWLTQPGHPVVKITISSDKIGLEQQRFYINPNAATANDTSVWPLPLLASDALSIEALSDRKASASHTSSQTPLMLNRGRSGFYINNYDAEHLARLADDIKLQKLSVIDRLGLLNDSLSLSGSGHQPTTQMLDLLEAYRQESSQPVWLAISEHIEAIKMLIEGEPNLKPLWHQFVADFARPTYKRLGWEILENESYQDTLLRPNIISLMSYGEDPEIIKYARNIFDQAKKPSDMPGDTRAIISATVVKHGGAAEFSKLLGWYKTASAAERIDLTAGLCNSSQPELIKQALDLITTDTVKPQDIFYWFIRLMGNHHSRPATWQWMQDNWQWITDTFGSDMHYTDFTRYSAAAFSTQEDLAKYRQFFEPLLEVTALERTIRQGLEEVEGRALWRERDLSSISEYLSNLANNPPTKL
jgi:aminopeptidase N